MTIANPPLGAFVLYGGFQMGFHQVLNAVIDGQNEIVILLLDGFGPLHAGIEPLPLGVPRPDQLFGGALQVAVIAQLKPFKAGGVDADKADQMTGQFAAGIVTFGFLDDEDSFDAHLLHETGLFGGDSPGEPAEILRAGQFFLKDRPVCLENGGEPPGHLAGVFDLGWIGADGIGHDGGGHLFAVPVEDDPLSGCSRRICVCCFWARAFSALPDRICS